jgi:F-type H+-transporting ATPase subunit gamma
VEVDPGQFPLLKVHEQVKRVAIVALTGDRGLSGAFNANVIRATTEKIREYRSQGVEVELFVVGRKGVGTFRFQGYEHRGYTGFTDRPDFSDAQAIARRVADLYVQERIDRVHLVYNHFKTAMEQYVTEQVILPIQEEISQKYLPEEAAAHVDFLFEPPAEVMLKELLPTFVEMTVYRALLESAASELGARMTAMRNASESAAEMIDTLTLAMNRVRQASITQEILEVVAGADALT